ncbi:MAG: tripartite tricarboxylate transporter substrate binding protein [Proteobacteria bacterium]|nr:tripartite tricarboxylate transporter substrate binding protein [Pseudomonadota bacterium]
MFRNALAGALLALASLAAQAQGYPSQTVRIIVGFPPGGTTDVIGRLVAQELTESLGRAVVVENRGGASGTIGSGIAAKSAPDGHTLLLVPSTHGTAPALYASLPYEDKDLVPAALVGTTPYVLVVHPSMAATNMAQLIAYLKQNPGKVEYASSSPGTAQHLSGELLQRMAGVNIVHIPYKGSGALMPDLLSGRVPMMFENIAIMTPHIKKGALRPIAVSSARRTPLLPDVPTVAETGLTGFEVLGWFALMAPAKTPPEIIRRLNSDVNAAIARPAIVARFAELGAEPLGGTPDQAAAFIRGEQEKWGKIIRDAGIKQQ